jgi:hypothetical protein
MSHKCLDLAEIVKKLAATVVQSKRRAAWKRSVQYVHKNDTNVYQRICHTVKRRHEFVLVQNSPASAPLGKKHPQQRENDKAYTHDQQWT